MKKISLFLIILLVFVLIGCKQDYKETLEAIMQTIEVPSVVVEDLDLFDSYTDGTYSANASWQSTNEGVITNDGKITVQKEDVNAILILRLSLNDDSIVKQFPVVVKGKESQLQEILNSIIIPSEVTGNLDLQTSYTLNHMTATAVWQTTASKVITKEGIVTPSVSDQSATLILELTYEDVTVMKQYDVVVKGNEDFLILYAIFNSQVNFTTYSLSNNITLPSSYSIEDKTATAVWESSNESALSKTGIIHQSDRAVTVVLTLTLTYNQASRVDHFTFTVLQDPESEPVNYWHLTDVYTNPIVGEALDPVTPGCFQGAIYRKVVSSKDYWLGIEALITIPEFIPDPERFDDSRLSYYLDNNSLYMGGHANYESDVGLGWSIGYENNLGTKISRSGIAFRPFWRYITKKEECTNNNCYRNANVSDFEYYYYPGDKIRMSVFSPEPGYLQMRIELIELTQHVKYANARQAYNLGTDFNRIFTTPVFPSEGMGLVKSEFKRVVAIDQVANEGKPTINTNAKVLNAIWHEVYLYRRINEIIYKVPMTESRSAQMRCPLGSNVNGDFTNTFYINTVGVDVNLGGEVITINPNNGTGRLYNLFALPTKKEDEKEI